MWKSPGAGSQLMCSSHLALLLTCDPKLAQDSVSSLVNWEDKTAWPAYLPGLLSVIYCGHQIKIIYENHLKSVESIQM